MKVGRLERIVEFVRLRERAIAVRREHKNADEAYIERERQLRAPAKPYSEPARKYRSNHNSY